MNNAISTLCCADNETRLTKKVKELNGEIVGNAAKVQTALRLSEEDQTTIVTLKKEVEKAWKLVDASHEKVKPYLLLHCQQDMQRSSRVIHAFGCNNGVQRMLACTWHCYNCIIPKHTCCQT